MVTCRPKCANGHEQNLNKLGGINDEGVAIVDYMSPSSFHLENR